jgi:flagellar hook-associated protein 1 FlgK
MSLISSIQLASTALQATQVGLQVVGQNIANANTPGYTREVVNLTPGPTQRNGGLLSGSGVEVQGIVQQVDRFLQERLRNATSDSSGAQVTQQTYSQLEGLVGELSDTDLSTSLDNFFSSISNVLNQPESDSVRNLAVLQGQTLAQDINNLASRAGQLRSDLNDRVGQSADDVNRLLGQVAKLNTQIADAEGGGASGSDAVGLRDQRNSSLTQLAQLIDVKTQEQPDGSVSVFAGGDFLVLEGTARSIKVSQSTDRGLTVDQLRIAETDSPLNFSSGTVAGLVHSRDDVLGTFLDKINDVAGTLAFEFNKIYSSGQGLKGYNSVTSQSAVDDVNAPLDASGLQFTPTNGQFDVQVFNRQTGLTQTTAIHVDLNGLDHDTSLTDLAAALGAVNGVSATITPDLKLSIQSTSSDQEIAFGNDSSGLLASLGINTFFTGSDALSLGINPAVVADPGTFAASRAGVGADTDVAVDLANFLDQPLDSHGGTTLSQLYDRMTSDVAQGSAVATSVADGAQVFQQSLNGQNLAISGVSIDEETVNLLQYQRSFQASAKYIATLNDLLNTLVNL